MKKIININFHSRVIPIEETAYEILQQYIESLRQYFAREEGQDEIISDIENRFSELFADKLKKGAACITDDDVNSIIASMGRPEDFEADDETGSTAGAGQQGAADSSTTGAGASGAGATGANQQGNWQHNSAEPRRLYRAENDKLLGGVCGGLANYLRLDPAVVRILFVLITFGWGFGFVLYFILWMVLPTRSLPAVVRKRLYRNPDDRVIGGVASGLAAYFHVEVWIPRLIFALPLILSVITAIIRSAWWIHNRFSSPEFITGGFGGTLFISYIVLWMILPEAVTASEKLEMRGEKVDLESIKNTVKSDLEGFKGRASQMGKEMGDRFKQMGKEMGPQIKQNVQNFSAESSAYARRSGSGLGHAIGVLFKVFFLFIAGIIAFSLMVALVGLLFTGNGVLDMKDYVLSGFWQNFLAWASFLLFVLTPILALLTWLIRRITGVRSRTHYPAYIFATLWVIGLFCFIALAAMVMNNFRSRQHTEDEITMSQPTHNKLVVKAAQRSGRIYDTNWWFNDNDWDWKHRAPFYMFNDDSILLTTIKVDVLKSDDTQYHVKLYRFSRSDNSRAASELAQQISFTVQQTDSILSLPAGFAISKNQKFRNQQVLVAISVPVGKRIMIDNSVRHFRWFNLSGNHRHINWSDGDEDNWDDQTDLDNTYYWNSNVEYTMTATGLARASRLDREEQPEQTERPEKKERPEQPEQPEKKEKPAQDQNDKQGSDHNGYRYQGPEKPAHKNNSDSPATKSTTMLTIPYRGELGLLTALVHSL
jgi:phage shock protein PspC (stress-responsive transcriptional regulator)